MFKIKTQYYLNFLTFELMKLYGSIKIKMSNDTNGEHLPHLELNKVVLAYCNIVNSDYQQDIRVLHIVIPNKSLGQLLDVSPKSFFIFKNI